MNKIKTFHGLENSYYFTEEMKSDGAFFRLTSNYEEESNAIKTVLNTKKIISTDELQLIIVKDYAAMIYNLYVGASKDPIEIYTMVNLVASRYEEDDFYDFLLDVSNSCMSSEQDTEELSLEIYNWLREYHDSFVEETSVAS